MRKKLCEACKTRGKYNPGDYLDAIYHTHGAPTYLRLCYGHSVELFKFGQKSFLAKYETYIPERGLPEKDGFNPLQNYFVFNSFR